MHSTTTERHWAAFLALSRDIAHLGSACALMSADGVAGMPPDGSPGRSDAMAYLQGLAHEKATSNEYGDALRTLLIHAGRGELTGPQRTIVIDSYKDYLDAKRLPRKFVEHQEHVNMLAEQAWDLAKNGGDWKPFLDLFPSVVQLARESATLRIKTGFSPYEILLQDYEPDMTMARLDTLFAPLVTRLADLTRRIAEADARNRRDGTMRIDTEWMDAVRMPIPEQARMCLRVAKDLGFDFRGGRIVHTTHPFMERTHLGDIWIAMRYLPDDFTDALGSVIHETGHALYEQALPAEYYGTAGGEAPSMGIHESQSRIWERLVGKSPAFCDWFCRSVGLRGYGGRMYRAINAVQPSLIRIEADEVTYTLHVILRYEIERALINGTLDPKDAPDAWNARIKELLGVCPTGYGDGIFQDSHWPSGAFGYFPSYAVGDIYAESLFAAATRDIPGLEAGFAGGKFAPLREWLREKVHAIGGLEDAEDIITAACGAPADSVIMLDRFERKYGELYGI